MSALDASHSAPNLAKPDSTRIRLVYLDGIRGLAALYVVVFHVYQECIARREMPSLVLSAVKFIAYPQLPVAIFIVLSGYCLMLPVIRSGKAQIPGGLLHYIKRRARHIR